MAAKRRPIPDDWEEHWSESIRALSKRYHADKKVICRWREETGHIVRKRRPIVQYAEDGTFIARYDSVIEAAIINYVGERTIRDCAKGVTKCGLGCGFIWRYEDAEVQRSA